MAPKNINDILNSMGAGGNTSALAPYSGDRGSNGLMNETIDERILRILGLQDVFDIDYDTYKSLLRERLAAARMSKSKIPAEEDELLRNEFKRIRGKEGRFKVKKKKITASSAGLGRSSGAIVKKTKIAALPASLIAPKEDDKKSTSGILENLKIINSTLDKILKGVVAQGQSDRKKREKERGASERRRAQERESALEKPLQVAKSLVKKVIAPFQGILDRVFRFLGFTFLGWVIGKYEEIQKWFSANKEKVTIVSRFLKDWGPALLGAFVLFATPFGAFIRGTLKMLRVFIPQIIRLMAANPMLAALTLATIGGVAKIKESERIKPLVEKDQAEIDKTLSSKEAPWYQKLGAGFANQSLNAPGGPKNPIGLPMPGAMYKGGGIFSGFVNKNTGVSVKGFGQDTQALPIDGGGTAVLKPGEVVMNTPAVNAIGADKLLGWNRQFGGPGANRPVNFTYNSGGIVGMQGGGIIGALSKLGLPGTGTAMAPEGRQWQGQGTVLDQILGFPVSKRQTTYSQGDINRYNKFSKDRKLISGSEMYKGPAGQYMANMTKTVPSGGGLDPFRNFATNIQTIQGTAKRQEEMMRQMGHKPSGYVNLFGQPVRRQSGGPVQYSPDQIKNYQMLYSLAKKHGATFPQLTAAMAMNETGWLKHTAGNNPFNQRGVDGKFMNYRTIEDAVAHHIRLWDKKRSGMKNIAEFNDPNEAFAGIVNSYAPPSENNIDHYKSNVSRIMSDMKGYNPKINPSSSKVKKQNPSLLKNIMNFFSGFGRKQSGGPFTTQTGFDIKGGLMGADTQLLPPMAVQPGEVGFIFTKKSVERGAVDGAMNLMEQLDPHSVGAKTQNLKRDIGPKVTFINLPDKLTSAQSKGGGLSPGKPQLPEFGVIMDSPTRMKVASTLGIADLV